MDIDDQIVGLELIQIQKRGTTIELIFRDRKTNKKIDLTYKGLLFETPSPVLNKRVRRIGLNKTLGFKATTQLRLQGIEPISFNQLFIEMEGSTPEHKFELIGAFKEYKIKTKRTTTKAVLSSIKKSRVNQTPLRSTQKAK